MIRYRVVHLLWMPVLLLVVIAAGQLLLHHVRTQIEVEIVDKIAREGGRVSGSLAESVPWSSTFTGRSRPTAPTVVLSDIKDRTTAEHLLAAAAGLTRLRSLTMDGSVWTRELPGGLQGSALRSHVRSMWCAPVYDESLAHMSACVHLEELNLSQTRVTDEGLKFIERLPRLKRLDCSWLPITDVGLARIAQIDSLEELILMGTEVTDAGILELKKMKSLSRVLLL